jgi:hypothetical protein
VAILRAMSRDPDHRFPSVRELGRALCEAADQRTRLLWTPSFGLRDVPFHRSTANLGSTPLRTGSPLSASVNRRPRRLPIWQLGLSALAVLMLALAIVVYWRMPTTPYAEVPPDVVAAARAAVSAQAPPVMPPESASSGVESARPAAESPSTPMAAAPVGNAGEAAPGVEGRRGEQRVDEQKVVMEEASTVHDAPAGASKGAKPQPVKSQTMADRAASKALAPSRAAPPPRAATSAEEARRQPPPEGDAPDVAEPFDDDDEVIFPVRAPSPSRPAPVLGANQSPILD